MTESQIERRSEILNKLFVSKKDRDNYNIYFLDSFIDIRNKKTLDGIYTDSLKDAKKWITEDLKIESVR